MLFSNWNTSTLDGGTSFFPSRLRAADSLRGLPKLVGSPLTKLAGTPYTAMLYPSSDNVGGSASWSFNSAARTGRALSHRTNSRIVGAVDGSVLPTTNGLPSSSDRGL